MQKKLTRLPRIFDNRRVKSTLKVQAEGVKKSIIDNIRRGGALPKMSELTRKIKTATGGIANEALYGGRSMVRGLKVIKQAKGWKVEPVGRHKSGLPQKKIWMIHERGISITITRKMRLAFLRLLGALGLLGKKQGVRSRKSVVRIPARQPMRRGYNDYIRSSAKKENDAHMRKVVRSAIVPLDRAR